MQRSSTKALSPASCLLACVLEVEVAGGRDPNTFVASFAKVLEADDSVGATSVLVKAQPTPRGRRAVEALFATLQQPTQPNDDPAPPLQPAQLKREALVRGLSAVDALSDFVAVASKGKPRALMALGSAARAGRAWTSVRESAEEIPQLPSQLPGLLGTVSGGELVDVSGLEQPGVRKALTRLFTALGLHVERSLTHDKGNGSEVATGFGLSSAPERKEEAALLRRSVDLLADTLSHADACGFPLVASIDNAAEEEIAGRGKLLAAAQAGSTAKAGSSSSSSSSSQSPPAEPRAPRGPMRGPAMPEPAALAAAAAASAEPYSVLGLTVGASEEDVRQAYKKLARRLHPDRLIRASPEEKQAAELSFEAVKAAHLFLLNVGPSAPDSHGPRGVAEDDYSDGDDSIDDEHDGRDGPTVQLMTTKSEKEAQDWGPLSCLSTSGKGHGANVDSSRGGAGCQGCQGGGSGGRSSSELAASKKRARDKEWELVRGGLSAMEAHVVAAAEEEKVVSASHQGGREEWMLVAPVDEGDGGFLSGLKKESNPTARGFQQMIPHSRQYAGLDDKEEAESSDAQKRAQNDPELEARIAEHKAARGPSLVEQYQLNSAKQGGGKKKPSGRGAGKTREEAEKDLWGGKGERDANSGEGGGSGFSIDEIMGGSGSVGGSKVSQHELGGMIADAKALDSRSMSWFGFGKSPDTSSDKLLVQKKLWSIYQKHVAPLEQKYSFGKFYTPELREADFLSPPMVMLLGQYSTGKTTMIEYLTGAKLPGAHIGPEPTTDRFVALMYGKEARTVPGHAACSEEDLPFKSLQTYGSSFLSKFEVTQVDSEMLKDVTFVDTPGVLSGEKQRTSRGYDFTAVTKHLAERADCILLLFDCSKLDISDELKGVIQSLEGNHDKVRCLLNKADQVDSQELFRVYGALLWSLGKVVDTPEVLRVFVASMRAGPYKSSEGNDRGNQQQQQQQQQKLQLLDRNSNFNSSNESSGSIASMISMGAPEEESEDSSLASQRERLMAPPSVVDLEASSPSPPNHRLFDLEREALLADLRALPRNAKVRRLDQVAKRFRAVKTHAMLCSHLRGEFGWVPLGQDSKQGELLRGLEGLQLGLARKHGLNAADFSDANHFKRVVRDLGIKIWKWPTTMDEELEAIDKAFAEDLKPLLAMLNDDPSGDITP